MLNAKCKETNKKIDDICTGFYQYIGDVVNTFEGDVSTAINLINASVNIGLDKVYKYIDYNVSALNTSINKQYVTITNIIQEKFD